MPAFSKTVLAREHLRRRYLPPQVRLLFVGEAPPASGRFFYQADSGLYRAIQHAFIAVLPALRDANFLDSFRANGCYLVDLCGRPVDRLDKKQRKQVCRDSEARLGRIIKNLQPRFMITVVRSITANVARAQGRANWSGHHLELPYPGRWQRHQIAFENELMPVLRRELTMEFSAENVQRDKPPMVVVRQPERASIFPAPPVPRFPKASSRHA